MDLEQFFGMLKEQVDFERRNHPNETYNNTWLETDFLGSYPELVIPYLVLLSTATLTGTIGNILVMGAVMVTKRLRTTGNMFIVNLALADIFVTTMVFPFCIIGAAFGPEFFLDKQTLCHIVAGICLPACVCSLWNMGAIALNRYIFLCHNHLYAGMYTKRSTVLMCIGLWIASTLTMELPIAVGWGGHNYDTKTMMCSYDRLADYSFTIFFCAFAVGTPMLLVFMFYLRIYCYVHASQKRLSMFTMNETNGKTSERKETNMERIMRIRKREEIQLAKTLFLVFFIYFSCWTPYAFVVIYDPDNLLPMEFHVLVTLLGHTNSSINSVIYAATNKQFRDGYKKFIGLSCGSIDRLYKTFSKTSLDSQSTEILSTKNDSCASQRF